MSTAERVDIERLPTWAISQLIASLEIKPSDLRSPLWDMRFLNREQLLTRLRKVLSDSALRVETYQTDEQVAQEMGSVLTSVRREVKKRREAKECKRASREWDAQQRETPGTIEYARAKSRWANLSLFDLESEVYEVLERVDVESSTSTYKWSDGPPESCFLYHEIAEIKGQGSEGHQRLNLLDWLLENGE